MPKELQPSLEFRATHWDQIFLSTDEHRRAVQEFFEDRITVLQGKGEQHLQTDFWPDGSYQRLVYFGKSPISESSWVDVIEELPNKDILFESRPNFSNRPDEAIHPGVGFIGHRFTAKHQKIWRDFIDPYTHIDVYARSKMVTDMLHSKGINWWEEYSLQDIETTVVHGKGNIAVKPWEQNFAHFGYTPLRIGYYVFPDTSLEIIDRLFGDKIRENTSK